LHGRFKTSIIFYQTRPGGQVRCAVGIGGQIACTLTDRLIPDMDPALRRKLDHEVQQKLEEKDKKIKELEKAADDLAKNTQSNTTAANAKPEDLETNNKKFKDTWKLTNIAGNTYHWIDGTGLIGIPIPSATLQGEKIQLWSKVKCMAMDWGDQGSTVVKLWGTAMHAHENQTMQFESCHDSSTGDDFWIITTLPGREFTPMLCPSGLPLTFQSYIVALKLQNQEVVVTKLDRQDKMQQWQVMKGDDQFSVVYVHTVLAVRIESERDETDSS
jgi:hypothetical protein